MGKGRKGRKRDCTNPKKYRNADEDMMDDEIDAFHKQRDIVPLDINGGMEGSDEDDEHPVFDFKDGDEEEDNNDEDEDIEDDSQLTGLAAKIARQQKYLQAKVGGVEDEMHDDVEDDEEKRALWGRGKDTYYGAPNVDYELQSDSEELAEEEAEVSRLLKEKAKHFSIEDFGLEDVTHFASDEVPTLEEILVKGKVASTASADKETHDDPDSAYEEVKKDLNALSKEERMDVVYSSAPELVGLLSELNDALEELENKVNPLLNKVREGGNTKTGGLHYMEVKQLLLLAYCQAITFYLLLKSEGQPVRDHPVIARLVEIKNLLDKIKQLDANLPSDVEDTLGEKEWTEIVVKPLREDVTMASDSHINSHLLAVAKQEANPEGKVDSSKHDKSKGRKRKHLNDEVGIQSMEMLKVRAALEEKLKQKGIFGSIASKRDKVQRRLRPLNGRLETLDDFDDDNTDLEKGTPRMSKGHATLPSSTKLSQLVTSQFNNPKVVSGDVDLPRRDDIGERRRKHELRVLTGASIQSGDDIEDGPDTMGSDGDDDMEDGGESRSDDEFYKQVKQQRAAKLAAKAEMYTRSAAVPSTPKEILVDGKRHITSQMEKNRGLTRARKKLTKNPRKKYKLKHQKAVVRRKGQVRDIKKPIGPYGGEASGINIGISRSIRFKN